MPEETRVADGAQASSRLTLQDMLHASSRVYGCPDPTTDRAITSKQLFDQHREDQVVWILQEWLRGNLEAYDPATRLPVLSPRKHRGIRASWDYVAGRIPGGAVTFGKVPTRLSLYGAFRSDRDGSWRLALHPQDRPVFLRLAAERPVSFSVPTTVQSGFSGSEETSALLLRISREDGIGVVAAAEYDGLPIFGVNAALHDLAQDCLSSRVFGREHLGTRERVLWANALAWFFSTIFARQLPAGMSSPTEQGSPESQVVHQAQTSIVERLATVIFDRDRVAEILAKFDANPVVLYPASQVAAPQLTMQADPVVAPSVDVVGEGGNVLQGAATERDDDQGAEPQDIYALMAAKLPDLLPRSALPKMCEELFGAQLIGKSTLEKHDMQNVGPPSERIGGRVHYRRDAFIQWFRGWSRGKDSGGEGGTKSMG